MARPLLGRAFEDATVGHRLAVAGCARLGAYATVTVASKLAFPDAVSGPANDGAPRPEAG